MFFISLFTNFRQIRNERKKQDEKFATKEYVKQETKSMHTEFVSLDKRLTESEKHNEREHDSIKEEFIRLFKSVDKKLDKLIKGA